MKQRIYDVYTFVMYDDIIDTNSCLIFILKNSISALEIDYLHAVINAIFTFQINKYYFNSRMIEYVDGARGEVNT